MNKEEIKYTIKPSFTTRKLKELQQENKKLQKQLDYLRSGEYYNQLRFERDMLQYLVEKGEVSKEDKQFIDCTHRNTELLEENKRLKEKCYEHLEKVADERMSTILDIEKYCIDEKEDLISGCEVCEDILKMIEKLKNKKY